MEREKVKSTILIIKHSGKFIAGFKQKLSENLSLIAKYQFIKYKYVLNIRSDTSSIEHNYTQHFFAGAQYAF